MRRYEDDYRSRGHPTTRRLDEPVRDDRHRLDRGEARERIRTADDSLAERPIRVDRDRERMRPERGERPDRGERMDFAEDPRIGVPRGDPRANTGVRREGETITAYRDAQGFLRNSRTHEVLNITARPVARPHGDDYDDDINMDRDEPPRRREREREALYYDSRAPRDDYDEVPQGSARPEYGMINFFIDGAGIEHQVIQTDICRHLGNDATVRRFTQNGREGYMVRGYRALTTAQLDDLKEASAKYRRYRRNDRTTGSYAEMRARDERDAMDVDMDYDPPPSRDRHRGEPEPRGGDRVDRHRMGSVPVTSAYVEPSYPAYTIGPGQGPYGAAQRPRTTGNYSPQGGRPAHSGFPPTTFDSRVPGVSMAPVAPTSQTYQDRPGQYIPIEPGVGGGFIPEPSRGGGRQGR
ncbi:hypothetical protein DV738_g1030, partial [Chaetothyriales sp. CBS 135597]